MHLCFLRGGLLRQNFKYRVYQNDWSGFEVDYIHKYGEQNYKHL